MKLPANWIRPSPTSSTTITTAATIRPSVISHHLMSVMAGESKYYYKERRCKYKRLIAAENITGTLESLLMPPDHDKVFGVKSVPFRRLTTGAVVKYIAPIVRIGTARVTPVLDYAEAIGIVGK